MYKIKAYHFNPVNVVCIALLCTIILLLTAFKPTEDKPPVDKAMLDAYQIRVDQMRDYQIELQYIVVNGKPQEVAMMYRDETLVSVMTLDNRCNLTRAIDYDNQ